jgi:hypothetical protein
VRNDLPVPYFWLAMPNQDPRLRADEISDIVKKAGGRLVEDQAFFDQGRPVAYALTEGPDDFARAKAMASALRATEMRVLLTRAYAEEAYRIQQGLKPDSSGASAD